MRDRSDLNVLGTVVKAVQILESFTEQHPEWGVRELSEHLSMPRSVVHRVLQTLALTGLLEQEPQTQRYRVGLKAFEIGQLYMTGDRQRREAVRVLREMADESTFTCYLGILDGPHAVVQAITYGPNPVRIVAAPGDRLPAHAAAFGKALLAGLPDSAVVEILGTPPYRQLTPKTPATPDAVLAALAEVRRSGYAVSREETYPGVVSIGAPVRHDAGRVTAALSISMPAGDFTPGLEQHFGKLVIRYASELSRRTGASAALF